jgi:hypothetical protein
VDFIAGLPSLGDVSSFRFYLARAASNRSTRLAAARLDTDVDHCIVPRLVCASSHRPPRAVWRWLSH